MSSGACVYVFLLGVCTVQGILGGSSEPTLKNRTAAAILLPEAVIIHCDCASKGGFEMEAYHSL